MFFCGAFSETTRTIIKERDEYRSRLSGDTDRPLVCLHLYHEKKHPHYDEPQMGFLATDIEEWAYHYRFWKNPKKIGLTEKENLSAIKSCYNKILFYDGTELVVLGERMQRALDLWDCYFEEMKDFADHPKSNQKVPPLDFEKEYPIVMDV